MRLSDYIFTRLAEYGVRQVFMISGGGAMFLNDALGCESRIQYICHHHEQACAIAAEGYARTTGKLSVVSVTTGPGGTNTLTGVIGQWLDSIPVLYISGQVKFSTTIASCPELPLRQLGDQEINIIDIVRPVTKYAAMITRPQDIRHEIEKAIHIATTGRKGPVWLDIPINVQSTEIDEALLEGFVPTPIVAPEKQIDKDTCDIVELLCNAASPVLIAGNGVHLAGAESTLLALTEELHLPVLTTFGGFDLVPFDHRSFVGRIGTIGTRAGNIALQNADFVLCLGSRNNIRQVSYNWENFARSAKTFAAVDIDAAELAKKTVRITHPICADIGDFIAAFRKRLSCVALPDWSRWLDWAQKRTALYPTVLPEYFAAEHGVQPYVFTEALTRRLPASAVVACANATPSIALFQAGIVKSGQRMFANSGCAAMGYGLSASIGAALAKRAEDATIVCLDGDGSLMMNIQELQTVAHADLPIKLFLYNNGEYCSIRQTQDNFFNCRHTGCDSSSGVTFPDWKKVADAFDWPYVAIDSHENLDLQIDAILRTGGRVFCDVRLVKGYLFLPKLSSRRLDDGQLISPSLEDMFPFLGEDEMKKNRYEP